METIYECCAGLDIHKKTVVACVLTPEGRQTRTFSTMTKALLELADWLLEWQVTHVAMESSGVFWKPIYNLLEGLDLTLLVVNARHMKAVPGRKTDVKDAEWIAQLLQHGLLRASYIPDRPQRELRELCAAGGTWPAASPSGKPHPATPARGEHQAEQCSQGRSRSIGAGNAGSLGQWC